MVTLISLVVLSHPRVVVPVALHPREVVFSERIRSALGEAWRALIG